MGRRRLEELARLGFEGVLAREAQPVLRAAAVEVCVAQHAENRPADGLARAWPAPDAGVDTHRVYMMQWYAFAALAGGLWIGFAVRRRLRGRRQR